MNLFFNISHPAHVHLFRHSITTLRKRGHRIVVVSRRKEFLTTLLDGYGVSHRVLTKKRSGFAGLLLELLIQQFRIAGILQHFRADMMIQMNGIFNAPVGRMFKIPTLAFSDTENDKWANRISFNLSRHVFVPTCFDHTTGGWFASVIHYPGYHELAYLSPAQINVNDLIHSNTLLLRFVGWGAGHDLGERGLTDDQKIALARMLSKYGKLYISSEQPLPEAIRQFALRAHPMKIHALMKRCKLIVGESATMASEAACLGIPAVFVSDTGRGYTTEQDERYGLIRHFRRDEWDRIMATAENWAGRDLQVEWHEKRRRMLSDKIDVSRWITDLIHRYPESIADAEKNKFEEFAFSCVE